MLMTDEGGVFGLTLKSTTCSTICPREVAAGPAAADILRIVGDLVLMRDGTKKDGAGMAVLGRRKAEEGNGFRWSICGVFVLSLPDAVGGKVRFDVTVDGSLQWAILKTGPRPIKRPCFQPPLIKS
ncbi:hypothetical protein MLD38_006940 [Melastoma candidum]|uniref:Uncharacterized protein n=1 Tax=Melastoma candidum TaxID=119954 RepID=A0ACB9RQR4_9MYRT|nr:hypothetical protein MLD38_006940 [Melastoma candidum]